MKKFKKPSDRKTVGTSKINWGKFSTEFSKAGLIEGLKNTSDLETLGAYVHEAWIEAVKTLWHLIDEGYEVEGGYTQEKKLSHVSMVCPFEWLSREDQLKDIYTIKDILTHSKWVQLGGEFYEQDFKTYNIGW